MHDEKTLRLPSFRDGARVRFADGQDWTLPAPPDGLTQLDETGFFDADYEALVAAVLESEDDHERRRAELCLVIDLLNRNYRLTPDVFQALLGYPHEATDLPTFQRALHAVSSDHIEGFLLRMRATDRPSVPGRRGILSEFGTRLLNALARYPI